MNQYYISDSGDTVLEHDTFFGTFTKYKRITDPLAEERTDVPDPDADKKEPAEPVPEVKRRGGRPKKEKVEDEPTVPAKRRGRPPKAKVEEESEDKPVAEGFIGKPAKEVEEEWKKLPMDLVNKYGRVAVLSIKNKKNEGIGWSALELYEMNLPGCGALMLGHIEEIMDGLEAVGL